MALARILSPNLFACYVSINLPTASWGVPRAVGKNGFGNLVTTKCGLLAVCWPKCFFVMCGSPQKPLLMHFSKRTHFYRMLYTYIHTISFCQQLLPCITTTQIPTIKPSVLHPFMKYRLSPPPWVHDYIDCN